MGAIKEHAEQVAASFTEETKDHAITEIWHEGIYGHWRFAKTGTNVCAVAIHTYPGGLVFTGDMGTYVLSESST